MAYAYDIGSQIAVAHSYTLPLTSHAAGVTTASTESMGLVIDRQALAGDYQSVKSMVAVYFVGATTQTPGLTVTLKLEEADSSESTSFSAFTTAKTVTIGSTAAAAATNYYGKLEEDIDLSGAARYIRQVVTVANVATCSSDTCQAEGVLIFGGARILPATS